jgi:hypothetical protein
MNNGLLARGHGNQNDEAETPGWLFQALDAEFGFTFDAAATPSNSKCRLFAHHIETATIDAGHRVYCNPPYSNIELFVHMLLPLPNMTVFLLPAFVDKDWYRLLYESPRVSWRPFRKRIIFEYQGKAIVGKNGNPQQPFFGTVLAIVRPVMYISK